MSRRRLVLPPIGALLAAAVAAALSACHSPPSHPPGRAMPPSETHPASHMSAIWRAPGIDVFTLGNHLVLRDPASRDTEVDPLDPLTARPLHPLLPPSFDWLRDASTDDLWIAQSAAPHLTAIDPVSLGQRWLAACTPSERPCAMRGARAGSVAVFAGVIEPRTGKTGIFAVSPSSGAQLWRTAPFEADGISLKLAADPEHTFVFDGASLRAFRTATGESLWTRALAPALIPMRARTLAVEAGLVAIWERAASGHILVLDADSGDERADIPWNRMAGEIRIEGGVLHVTSLWDGDGMEVAAFEALTGRPKWHARRPDRWLVPPLALAEDALFLLCADSSNLALNGRGTEILALDRESGRQVFAHPVGLVEQMAFAPRAPGGSVLAFAVPGGEVIAMQRTAAPAAPRTVTLSGTLISKAPEPLSLSGLRVEVAGTVVRSDEQGRFSARVSALGALKVRLLDLPRPTSGPPLRAEPALLYVGGESAGPSPTATTAATAPAAADELRLETTLVIEVVSPWPRD